MWPEPISWQSPRPWVVAALLLFFALVPVYAVLMNQPFYLTQFTRVMVYAIAAIGFEGQHAGHQQVDQHRRQRRAGGLRQLLAHQRAHPDRQEDAAQGIDHADDQRGPEGAADRADAADDDHHQGLDQDGLAHARLHREDRPGHHPGQRRQAGTQAENQGVEQADVHAQGRHHRRMGGAGADQHAHPGAVDQPVEEGRHRQPDRDHRQPVGRVVEAGQRYRAVQPGRRLRVQRADAPDHAHRLVEKQHQAKGGQHLVEVVALVQAGQRNAVDGHAQHHGAQHRAQRAEQEGPRGRRDGGGQKGPHHVERAMRQVDKIHDAEDQRQPGCQQEQQHPELQPVEHLGEDQRRGHGGQEKGRGCVGSAPGSGKAGQAA